jgi:hypothetical protein
MKWRWPWQKPLSSEQSDAHQPAPRLVSLPDRPQESDESIEGGKPTGMLPVARPTRGDERTRVVEFSDRPAPSAEEAFRVGFPEARNWFGNHPSALFVAAAIGGNPGQRHVLACVGIGLHERLVLGRHSHCDVLLDFPWVPLRYLMAFAHQRQETPVLRVLDLNTRLGFLTEEGQRREAIVTDGSVFVSTRSLGFWFYAKKDLTRDSAQDAWTQLGPVDIEEPGGDPWAAQSLSSVRPVSATLHRMEGGTGASSTRITALHPPLVLEQGALEIPWGTLKLRYGDDKAKWGVSAERLQRGILVGRYERCGLELAEQFQAVSRVHLLLLLVDGDVWALDTASTFGIWREQHRVLAERLEDGASVRLDEEVFVDWHRIKHPEA